MRSALLFVLVVAACGSSSDSSEPDSKLPDRNPVDGGSAGADGGGNGTLDANVLDDGGSSTTCTVGIDATVAATVKTSVDDHFKLYVNGKLVKDFSGLWTSPQTDSATLFRHPSKKNVIAVEGINEQNAPGLDRMIVVDLSFDPGTGERHVVTDATWMRSPGGLETNWSEIDFAEANWKPATVEGSHGDPPYNAVLGTSTAKYIWSYDSAPVDTMTKPASETVYFRKTFYIDLAGEPRSAPEACP